MNTLIRDIEQAGIKPLELLRVLGEPRRLSQKDHRDRAVIAEAEFTAKTLGTDFAKHLWNSLDIEKSISGGGGLTQSYNELYYVSIATGTQLDTFTTEASLMGALPHCIIPAGFFNGTPGRTLRMLTRGQLGTTGTPTYTFSVRLISSTTFSAGGGLGVSSAAITTGSGLTLAPWTLSMEIVARSVGAGGASNTTLAFSGDVQGQTAFASPFYYTMPAANVAFTGSLDSSATQYLYVSVACNSSSGSNLVKSTIIKVYAEN